MEFSVIAKDNESKARAGVIKTSRGIIPTPVFMPVGTAGTVKGVEQNILKDEIRVPIILANTYHLFLRPSVKIIKDAGGLHNFMNWHQPILTDSGGFQMYSLSKNIKVTDDGVRFSSFIDGMYHTFTPESVIDTQTAFGSDFMMVLDECVAYPCEYSYVKKSLHLTHRWAERSKKYFSELKKKNKNYQSRVLGIVQGSTFKDLREEGAKFISDLDMEANAIGGLSVGEPAEMMYEMTDIVTDILPREKPRYLMGVGMPENLVESISLGIDMFDCVLPTRNGRNGMLFTKRGVINIHNAKYKNDFSPIEENSGCFVDKEYSKAYLRHLFQSGEMLGGQLASVHNLYFYNWLLNEARKKIMEGKFMEWKNKIITEVTRRL